MSSMKALASKRMSKNVSFMDEKVKINKLTVAEVLEIQDSAKKLEDNKDDTAGFSLLRQVIRLSVEDAQDLTDEDFNSFPMDELSKLSAEIMKFSGMSPPEKEGK